MSTVQPTYVFTVPSWPNTGMPRANVYAYVPSARRKRYSVAYGATRLTDDDHVPIADARSSG